MLHIENLREGEKVALVLKRHWIVFIFLLIYTLTGFFLSMSLYIILWLHVFSHMLNISFWLGYSLFLYVTWLNHDLDMFIITDNRIIGIEQHSFLNREVSECDLSKVQEVNSTTKWFFSNILNYGTLSIQTAGSSFVLKMDFAPDPMNQARKILNILNIK